MYDNVGVGGWVGGWVRGGLHRGDMQAAPNTLKAHHHTKGRAVQVKQEKQGLPSAWYPSSPDHFLQNMN